MKINDYKIELNEQGKGILYAFRDTEKIYVGEIDTKNLNAIQIEEIAQQLLKAHSMEVVDVSEIVFMPDQRADIGLVRNEIRKGLKDLGNKNTTLREKKDSLEIHHQIADYCQIMLNACKLDLAYEQCTRKGK